MSREILSAQGNPDFAERFRSILAVVFALVFWAGALEAEAKPRPRSASRLTEPVLATGRLDGVRDGLLVLSQPIPEDVRAALARGRNTPLSSIPLRTERTFGLRGVSRAEVEAFLGQEVEVQAVRDLRGFYSIVAVGPRVERDR